MWAGRRRPARVSLALAPPSCSAQGSRRPRVRYTARLLALLVVAATPLPAAEAPRTPEPPDPYAGLRLWVGDVHVHTGLALYRVLQPEDPHSIGTAEEVLDEAESRGLHFVVITEHSNNVDDPRGVQWRKETGNTLPLPGGGTTASEWEYLQAMIRARNRPGRFLAFLGLEYTRGETETARPGHQAGIFPGDTLPRYCSNFEHNVGDCPTAGHFYAFVREQGGVAIMAHPCEQITWGFSDWSAWDPVVNAMEIVSGKCEFGRYGYNWALGERGLNVGARGSSDSHEHTVGIGDKTVCFAPELTREAILDAMRGNRCYYVDRYPVEVRFSINGTAMGGTVEDDGTGISVKAVAHSDWETDLDTMELIHQGKVAVSRECRDSEYDDCALETFILSDTGGYYYVALSGTTGRRLAITSPIWVRPPE